MNIKSIDRFYKKELFLFFALLLIFNANLINLKYPESGDNLPVRYIPFSIIKEFNFDLDEYYSHFMKKYPSLVHNLNNKDVPYYLIYTGEHYVHTQGPGAGILSLPIFLFSLIFFNFTPDSRIAFFLTKFTASLLIASSAVFLYAGLKQIAKEKIAFYIALIYSLCSCVWSISSQQMWQHTGSEFFLAMSIYFLIKGLKQRKFVAYSGFSLASAVVTRPTNGIVFIILSIYILHKYRDQILKFIVYATAPTLFLIWYNHHYFGSIFIFGQLIYGPICALIKRGTPYLWSTPFVEGLSGLMFSPSRGLLVYSPVFMFSFLGIIYTWRRRNNLLQRYLSIAFLSLLVIACKWFSWWGGHTFGYRPIVDTMVFLCIFFIPIFERINKNKILKSIFVILVLFSFCIQLIGAFLYNDEWNSAPDIDHNQERLWSWTDNQIVYYVRKLAFSLFTK